MKCPYKYRDVNPWQIKQMESCLCQLSMIIIIKCKDSFLFVIRLTVILFVGQKKVYSVSEYSKMQIFLTQSCHH